MHPSQRIPFSLSSLLSLLLLTLPFPPPTLAVPETTNAAGCTLSAGNWYCASTKAVTYTNFGQLGSYDMVSAMNVATGKCSFSKQSFGGGMAPLDGEVSWHFRGPVRLKGFAAYTLGGGEGANGVGKREEGEQEGEGEGSEAAMREEDKGEEVQVEEAMRHRRRSVKRLHHRHWHFHEKRPDPMAKEAEQLGAHGGLEERGIGDWVTATINGKVVSWRNQYGGGSASPATPAPQPAGGRVSSPAPNNQAAPVAPNAGSSTRPSSAAQQQQQQPQPSSTPKPTAPVVPSPSSPPAGSSGSGTTWTRYAHYSATSQTSNGLTFLSHLGSATCSGTFDTSFGSSLSYVSSSGLTCSPSPQILADTLIPDNVEITLMTSSPCSATSPCPGGTSRPGAVNLHGFGGGSKLFLVEVQMPLSGVRGRGLSDDMPAMWLLNAAIPRSVQYGACSCWKSGCGELDVLEVLSPGERRAKSTWHGGASSTGESDWFERPTVGSVKVAVVLDGRVGKASIVLLDDGMQFGEGVSDVMVQGWLGKVGGGKVMRLPAMVS